MNYFYYTLYEFYTKFAKVQRYYPPIIDITALLAVLINFFFFSFVRVHCKFQDFDCFKNAMIIEIITTIITWYFLYKYYLPREKKIIEKIGKKPKWQRVVSIILFLLLSSFIIYLWMFNGAYNIYNNLCYGG